MLTKCTCVFYNLPLNPKFAMLFTLFSPKWKQTEIPIMILAHWFLEPNMVSADRNKV